MGLNMIKRLTTEKQRETFKDLKKFKGRNSKSLTRQELDELIILIAKKLDII